MSASTAYIATGGDNGILRLWKVKYQNNNINSVALDKEIAMHSAQINGVAFNGGSDLVFSASSDKTCRVFSVKDGKQLRCLSFSVPPLNTKFEFRSCLYLYRDLIIRFHPGMNCLITLATLTRKESYVTFWNVAKDFDPIDSIKIHDNTSYRLTATDNKLAVGSNDGYVTIFDIKYIMKCI